MKVCINGQGHMTKMAAMALNKNIFLRTKMPTILKLDMKDQRMELYKIFINHDAGIAFTCFTARSM